MRRLLLGALLAAACLPAAAHAATPRTSLPEIERQVMCVTCKIPLNVAQSQQADRERALIKRMIDAGEGEAEVKKALVAEYGAAVLGLPSASGFDLTAYLVPLAAVLALVALLLVLLPRWRRRARVRQQSGVPAPPLDAADAARLESDLARFD
jgi:cytochrome c-type biogenesis protein CcmH